MPDTTTAQTMKIAALTEATRRDLTGLVAGVFSDLPENDRTGLVHLSLFTNDATTRALVGEIVADDPNYVNTLPFTPATIFDMTFSVRLTDLDI